MGAMKNYLNTLVTACSPESSTDQDALEYAVIKGWVGLAYDLDKDRMTLLGKMEAIRKAYAEVMHQHVDELYEGHEPITSMKKEAA